MKPDHIITDPIEALEERIEYCKYRISKIVQLQKKPSKRFFQNFNNDPIALIRATNNYIEKYNRAIINFQKAIEKLKS